MDLGELNAADPDWAVAAFLDCCASTAWAAAMERGRPYRDDDQLLDAAEREWWQLTGSDWLEAFAAHPRIGQRREGDGKHASWSRREQAGAGDAEAEVLAELARLNELYEERFGHVYLVFASGKSAEEMLDICRDRIDNEPDEELRVAAAEQAKITKLRLGRLLAE